MTDNDMIRIFLPILQAGLIASGFTTTNVKQSNQPTQQGVNSTPVVYFYKVSNKRYGFLGRDDLWDDINSAFVHTESQYFETTFRISALVKQLPTDTSQPTASDLVNEAAWIMQSDTTRDTLNNSGIGILRIQDIENPYFVDDHDQFEASPAFNFILTSEAARVSTTPVIQLPLILDIHGV